MKTKTNKLKAMALTALAIASFAAPLSVSTSAAADPPRQERRDNDRADRHDRDERRDQRQWRRGERPSASDRSHWRNVDYRARRLNAPPRGYHYVRDDRSGQYLLVGIATGVILSAITN